MRKESFFDKLSIKALRMEFPYCVRRRMLKDIKDQSIKDSWDSMEDLVLWLKTRRREIPNILLIIMSPVLSLVLLMKNLPNHCRRRN
jgi:hypothetical protein